MEHAFGRGESLALGVEEELLLVAPGTLALDHRVSELLPRLDGAVKPDVYEAEIETASPVSRDAAEAVEALGAVRERLRRLGPTPIGRGIHPERPVRGGAARAGRALRGDRGAVARLHAALPPARAAGPRRPLALLARARLRLRERPTTRSSGGTSVRPVGAGARARARAAGRARGPARPGPGDRRELVPRRPRRARRDGDVGPAPDAPGALEEAERILREGNGADRMRAAHAEGGMRAVLERLVAESAQPA